MPHNGAAYRMPSKPSSGPAVDFHPGSGEGPEIPAMMLKADSALDLSDEEITAACSSPEELLIATANPPTLLALPWELLATFDAQTSKSELFEAMSPVSLAKLDWFISPGVLINQMNYSSRLDAFSLLTSCGRVYLMRDAERIRISTSQQTVETRPNRWHGQCVYGLPLKPKETERPSEFADGKQREDPGPLEEALRATETAFNARFSLVSVGLAK
jgi:hypothetical protein